MGGGASGQPVTITVGDQPISLNVQLQGNGVAAAPLSFAPASVGAPEIVDPRGAGAASHNQDAIAKGKTIDVNSDLTQRVVMNTGSMPWDPSPWIPGIGRKFLDRYGNGQFVPSTSVVRFAPGISDPYHAHPHGEEFYMMSGVFTDHTGDYLPGFYIRHPIRWCHAPFVDIRNEAAVVWVKVSQVTEENEPIIVVDTCDMSLPAWHEMECTEGSIRKLPLHESKATGEKVWIELWMPGAKNIVEQADAGEEIFVLSGALVENDVEHPDQTWVRNPTAAKGTKWTRSSPEGCKLMMKTGHMPQVTNLYELAKDKEGKGFSSAAKQYTQEQRIHGDLHGKDDARRAREKTMKHIGIGDSEAFGSMHC